MSTDRRRPATNAPVKPLTPRLAASATPARAAPAPAPKLAGYSSPSPSASTASAASRRPLSTNISEANIAPRAPDATDSTSSKDPTANITPRSLARKTRADSVQSTPAKSLDESPAQRRPVSVLSPANVGKSRAPLLDDKITPESNRLSSPASFATRVQQGQGYPLSPLGPAIASGKSDVASAPASEDRDSYFFRANDVQKEQTAPRPALHKHTTSFVYANGRREPSPEPGSASHTSSPAQSRPVSFARSDSAPPSDSIPPSASAVLNLASRPTLSPPPQVGPGAGGLRAPSPPRQGIHLSYRKGISQIIRPSPLSPNAQAQSETRRRQSSIDGVDPDQRRSRTLSVSSSGSQAASRKDNSGSLQQAFTFPVPTTSSALSSTSFNVDPRNGDALKPLDTTFERVTHSPPEVVESADSSVGMNEAAANARRERKVLDLQISNSSLLAINKSLEKEVRKQKLELRRYRRMSRLATRESLISQTSVLSDGQYSMVDNADNGLMTEVLEEEAEGEDEDEPEQEESDSEDFGDDPTSPGAISQREVRHLKSDQRRLAVDLAKHKELLADSQRMNQSILKCLNVTEQLIKDGNRALEYQVPLDEIRLGGRVLSPEEQEEGDMSSFLERQAEDSALDDAQERRAQRHDNIVQEVLDSADALHMHDAGGSLGETY